MQHAVAKSSLKLVILREWQVSQTARETQFTRCRRVATVHSYSVPRYSGVSTCILQDADNNVPPFTPKLLNSTNTKPNGFLETVLHHTNTIYLFRNTTLLKGNQIPTFRQHDSVLIFRSLYKLEQERKRTYNVTLRHLRGTIVAVEKQ
jgi:hypothetical protein